jgi:hypothetical protein
MICRRVAGRLYTQRLEPRFHLLHSVAADRYDFGGGYQCVVIPTARSAQEEDSGDESHSLRWGNCYFEVEGAAFLTNRFGAAGAKVSHGGVS